MLLDSGVVDAWSDHKIDDIDMKDFVCPIHRVAGSRDGGLEGLEGVEGPN